MNSPSRGAVAVGFFVAVIAVCSAVLAKSQKTTPSDDTVSNAMRCYIYVGEGKCATLGNPPHAPDAKALPAMYLSEHCYVFHIPISTNEEFYTELENHLTESGVKVTKAPRTAADFVYLTSGGPLFQIQFQQGRRQGTLTTLQHLRRGDSDPELDSSLRQEDLVLRYSH